MIDLNNLCHFIGGVITAVLVIWLMDRPFEKLFVGFIAICFGLLVNCLWEIFADQLHILPFHANSPDIADVLRGGFGSFVVVVVYFICGKK